jgi:hypothetical protein
VLLDEVLECGQPAPQHRQELEALAQRDRPEHRQRIGGVHEQTGIAG